jgi:hypothetical protein
MTTMLEAQGPCGKVSHRLYQQFHQIFKQKVNLHLRSFLTKHVDEWHAEGEGEKGPSPGSFPLQ